MILEALVVVVCAQGQGGCGHSTSAYYKQSKQLQAVAKRVDDLGKRYLEDREWIVYVGTPLYALATKKPAKVLIYKGTTFNIDPWNNAVGLQWSY